MTIVAEKSCIVCGLKSHRSDWQQAQYPSCDSHSRAEVQAAISGKFPKNAPSPTGKPAPQGRPPAMTRLHPPGATPGRTVGGSSVASSLRDAPQQQAPASEPTQEKAQDPAQGQDVLEDQELDTPQTEEGKAASTTQE